MTIRNDLKPGITRAMFFQPTAGNFMSRGPTVTYDADDGTSGGGDDEAARAAAEAAAAEAAAAEEAARKAAEEAEKNKNKPSDAEARLLKDAMKHKKAAADAQAALDAANAKLKDFDGLDPAKLRQIIADQEAAELAAAEKRGEYDRIIKQVRDDATAREQAQKAEHDATRKQLEAAQAKIDDLVIGSRFTGSRFINEDTVLSGDKARRLYGDHFEIEDGQLVAYDKPRGSSDRTPLVDPQSGDRLGFDAAIEKIVKADPDFERIAKSKLRQGANSQQGGLDKTEQGTKKPVLSGRDLIAANLSKLKVV